MVSLVFNARTQGPQRLGGDEFRRRLAELAGNHLIIDERGGNTMGSENAVLAALVVARSTWGPSPARS